MRLPRAAACMIPAVLFVLVLICSVTNAQDEPGAAAAANSDQSQNFESLADGYFDLKDFENAAVYYEKAIELDPENAILHYNLAMTFKELKSCKAAEHFDEYLFLSDNPEDEKQVEQWVESIENKCRKKHAEEKDRRKKQAREKSIEQSRNNCDLNTSAELSSGIINRGGLDAPGSRAFRAMDAAFGNLLRGVLAMRDTNGRQIFSKARICDYTDPPGPSRAMFAFRIQDHPDHILVLDFDLDRAVRAIECHGSYMEYEYFFKVEILYNKEMHESPIRNTTTRLGSLFRSRTDGEWADVFSAIFHVFDRTGVALKIDTSKIDI